MPIVYQLMKSVGHSTMALSQVVGPYLDNPADQSWRGPMLAYRSRMQSALDGLDLTPITPEWRDTNRTILQNNIAFMDECLAKGTDLLRRIGGILQEAGAHLKLNIAWAAQTQVAHWMGVLADWKKMLGSRLGQDLCSQQHHLRRAPEQHPVQRPGAVFRTGGHQRPPDLDRDHLLHHHAGGHAGGADPRSSATARSDRCSSATIA